MPKDGLELTPVWIDVEGDDLVFNSVKGRAKVRNLEKNPYVAVSVVDPDDPYNVLLVRGRVQPTEEGAEAHIDALANKYLGLDRYANRQPGEVRVKYRVRTERIVRQPRD